jgi:hypothetical protein
MSVEDMLEGGQSWKGRRGFGMRHDLNYIQVNKPEYAVKVITCSMFSRHV